MLRFAFPLFLAALVATATFYLVSRSPADLMRRLQDAMDSESDRVRAEMEAGVRRGRGTDVEGCIGAIDLMSVGELGSRVDVHTGGPGLDQIGLIVFDDVDGDHRLTPRTDRFIERMSETRPANGDEVTTYLQASRGIDQPGRIAQLAVRWRDGTRCVRGFGAAPTTAIAAGDAGAWHLLVAQWHTGTVLRWRATAEGLEFEARAIAAEPAGDAGADLDATAWGQKPLPLDGGTLASGKTKMEFFPSSEGAWTASLPKSALPSGGDSALPLRTRVRFIQRTAGIEAKLTWTVEVAAAPER